jgi:hypothetical protein
VQSWHQMRRSLWSPLHLLFNFAITIAILLVSLAIVIVVATVQVVFEGAEIRGAAMPSRCTSWILKHRLKLGLFVF